MVISVRTHIHVPLLYDRCCGEKGGEFRRRMSKSGGLIIRSRARREPIK